MQDLIETAAAKLGAPTTSLKLWRSRGAVPAAWRLRIAALVRREHGVELTDEHFDALRLKRERAA